MIMKNLISKHYKNCNEKREKLITEVICDTGNIIDSFVVDRGHKDGEEIHSITDMGVVIIRNKNTNKLITKLIARPNQIRKYYRMENRKPPQWLLDLSEWHQSLNYNYF